LPRIPGLDDLKDQQGRLDDIANKLDAIVASSKKYADNVRDTNDSYKDLARDLDAQVQKMQSAKANMQIIDQKDVDLANDMVRKMEKLAIQANKLTSIWGKMGDTLDKVGKGLLKIWGTGAAKGINLLVEGIQRVYDLEERWAKVTGEVNQKLGKLSPSMKTFWKESRQAESAIRGLGGELGEGTKMFADFVQGFGKMDVKGLAKIGVTLAQGFDMGGEAAGKFTRALDNMGFDEGKKEVSEYMKELTVGAETAGVSVNALAKDFAESTNFISQFGKEGAKALVKSAAYLKSFNISLKDTEKMMDKFDSFEDAATSVGKFNTVFRTSINALDVMLEQDPAKRFETFRKAMLDQGKNWDTMSRMERKVFSEQIGLSEDQSASLLKSVDAGKSYTDFMKQDAKNKEKAVSADKMMKQQLQATAKTLYNFGAAFDRITVAIAKAIKPFTDMLGLTKSSDKSWKSFGSVMEGITKKIVAFFNALGDNEDFQNFMKMGAKFVKEVASKIADFFSPENLGRNIQKIIDALKVFAKVSIGIVGIWGAMKIGQGIQGAVGLAKNISSLSGIGGTIANAKGGIANSLQGGPGFQAAAGGGMGAMAKMGLGAAGGGLVGAGVGSMFGATTGGGVGGALGGGLGALAGPAGAAIGTAIGTAAGIYIEKKIDTSGMGDAKKRLSEAEDKLALSTMELEIQQEKASQQRERRDRVTGTFDKIVERGKKYGITLTREEQNSLAERLTEMKGLGINVRASDEALKKLGDPSTGPVKLTADYINTLGKASQDYAATIKDLDDKSKNLMETIANDASIKQAKQGLELDKSELEHKIKSTQMEIEREKAIESTTDYITGGNDKRRALEDKLRELQRDRVDIDTRGVKLDDKIIQQKRALFELDNLKEFHAVEYKKALEESGGDAVKMLEKVASLGVAVSADTVNYVKGSARTSKAVGPTPHQDFGSADEAGQWASNHSGASVRGGDVYLDGEKVGSVLAPKMAHHVAKHSLNEGRTR
jgi:tetrahydromethanopterin S-methyltransferase subunit G